MLKQRISNFFLDHKEEIITVGAVGAVMICGFLFKHAAMRIIVSPTGVMNYTGQSANANFSSSAPPISGSALDASAVPETQSLTLAVRSHIRKLHEGWNPSLEKVAEAAQKGVKLEIGQTFVKGYTRKITIG